MTLYAVWRQVTLDRHTVTFVPNDDGSDDPSFTVEVGDGRTVAEPAEPTPYAETFKESWEFRGWGDASGDPYDFDAPVTDDLVLTAGWKKNSKIVLNTIEPKEFTITPAINDFPTVRAGQTLDLSLDQLSGLTRLSTPPQPPGSSLQVLSRGTRISVTGCASLSAIASIDYRPSDEIALTIALPDPACFSGMSVQTVIPGPPEGGPVPRGTIVKLCQIFCYSDARATVESTPRFLGNATSDEVGRMSLTSTIPTDLEPGRHTIVFTVEGGEELRYPITVAAPAQAGLLPDTGAPGSPSLLAWGALMLVGGVSMVVASRRQDSSERR